MLRLTLAWVAGDSVRSMSKERGTRVNWRAKNGASKERGGGGEERKETFPPPPPLSFFSSRFISRAVKTKNPLPRSSFLRN